MAKNHDKRQVSGDKSKGKGATFHERAESRRAPASPYERRWSRYHEWAAAECSEGSWGPTLTIEGRAQLEANRANPNS